MSESFPDALAAVARNDHEDGMRRAKAVAGWFLGGEEWAPLLLASYAGVTSGLYGIASNKLREALVERLGPDEAERLMGDGNK